jgi:hypothetical protein
MSNVVPFKVPPWPKPIREPFRIVQLSRPLLDMAVALERDGLMAEMAAGDAFANRVLQHPDMSVAVLQGGYFVACGGLVLHWLGRAEAWALVSGGVDRRQIASAARLCRRWLDYRQRNPIFRRIECYVREAAEWRGSFMHALGFDYEATLEAWGPDGSDFAIYARVREYD